MVDKKYKYIGGGLGIPGLPQILTDKEAVNLGVLDLLKDAVKAGKYKPITTTTAVRRHPKSEKQSEVNHG